MPGKSAPTVPTAVCVDGIGLQRCGAASRVIDEISGARAALQHDLKKVDLVIALGKCRALASTPDIQQSLQCRLVSAKALG
eukprot:5818207-Pyramimonas_sp.AAC.1